MSDISKIQLPDSSEYDIKDTVARAKGSIYYGTCTTAAGTKDKVATVSAAQNFVLQVGTMVGIKFTNSNSYNATSSNKITLNVNSTGALNIWYYNTNNNTGNTAAYGVANVYNYYMYDGTYWVFAGRSVDFNDGNYNLRFNAAIKANTSDLVAGNIICASSGGLYSHLKTGNAFDIKWPILYANGATTASSTSTNNYILINFNVNTTQSMTLTAYSPVYIKGTLSGTMFTPISTAPLTQTEPTTVDGYYYMLLGVATSTTHLYLLEHHPIYVYTLSGFKIYDQSFAVNKKLKDVDLNTVKESGFYYADGNNGCSNIPSGYTQVTRFGLVVIVTANTNYLVQIYSATSSNMYSRSCSNGTWTTWNKFNTRVYQTVTDSSNWRKVVLSSQNDASPETAVSATNEQVYLTPSVEVQASTGTLRTTNLKLTKVQNQMLTGTGTAARDAGETADPRYFPAKWTYNANITPADGDIIVIKIPVAGHTYGVFISVNNGTTYYPISVNGTTRLTTNYGNGQIIALVFASNGQTNDMFPLDGGNSRVNISGGCWRVTNYYDSNTTYSAMSSSELTTGTTTTSRVVRSDYLKTGINSLIDTKIQALDVTGDSSIAASKTIKSWSETDGKVSVTTQDISISKSQVIDFPTLGTAAAKDVPASGNASTTQVVMGDDTRLSDSRTPKSHTHGNIANGGTISSTAVTPANTDYILMSDTSNSGKIERGIAIGTDTTKYLRNDGTWQVPPDTKNTAGSTDTSSKIYLVGATSQAANPQTYSDNEVYVTNGVLTTKSVQVGGTSATMQYNSTNECIEFIFS